MVSADLKSRWSGTLLRWQRRFGRQGLPWQQTSDPYRVWLSEIMLQQTQVSTVLAYYEKFLRRFPAVQDLARASEQEVMSLWAGLGYYSRARNLHACAQIVVQNWEGIFPDNACDLQRLPGIGRSTAAAIASFCYGERVAILDGNVKRVLARISAYPQDLSIAKNELVLWELAQDLLPKKRLAQTMPRYTQAMMDLGATVCLPRKARCQHCPVQSDCQAYLQGRVDEFPVKTKKIKRTAQSYWLLQAKNPDGSVFLERRPAPGIWAGLHCFPLYESETELLENLTPKQQKKIKIHAPFLHVLTHRDLYLHLVELEWHQASAPKATAQEGQWVSQLDAVGLPAPLAKILKN